METKLTTQIMYELFKDEKVMYIGQADIIQANHYISWENRNGKFIISVGSDEGEIPFKLVNTKEDVEDIIKLMMR